MEIYSIGLATDWPLDDDFFEIIEQVAHNRGLTTYIVYPFNLDETISRIRNNEIRFLSYYDRASDTSPQFLKIYPAMTENKVHFFVNLILQKKASDKAFMHDQFVLNELAVPRTIIIPELVTELQTNLTENDLDNLGKPFVIKPCLNTGSGSGVFLNAYTLEDVEEKRGEFPGDKYLLQEKIDPREQISKRFWFRVFYICGKTIITWWHNDTHKYELLADGDDNYIDPNQFTTIMQRIYNICGLNFFSTELAITTDKKVYAIDYVNEICDMRLQSKYADGIPDEVVKNIAEEIVGYLKRLLDLPSDYTRLKT